MCPTATLVDISHHIPPGDTAAGAFVLGRALAAFPPGTVHLAVVDPGVGGSRRALAVTFQGGHAVGPDNGLLTPCLDGGEAVSLDTVREPGAEVSATFHGRDLFAPAAARLARGDALRSLGRQARHLQRLPDTDAGPLRILHVDHFGNCVTSIPPASLPAEGGWQLQAGTTCITRRVDTYCQAGPGEAVVLAGSDGRMEIAVRDGHAANLLKLQAGMQLDLQTHPSASPRREKHP